jgi:hypothetical protein
MPVVETSLAPVTSAMLCTVNIEDERHEMLTSGVALLRDNVHLHIAVHTRALLEHFNCELLDHPPYSPNLVSGNCYLFACLKN